MTFIEAFYASSEINTINQKTKERINQFQDMISDFRNFAVEHGVDEILQKVWEVTGYMKELEFENTNPWLYDMADELIREKVQVKTQEYIALIDGEKQKEYEQFVSQNENEQRMV